MGLLQYNKTEKNDRTGLTSKCTFNSVVVSLCRVHVSEHVAASVLNGMPSHTINSVPEVCQLHAFQLQMNPKEKEEAYINSFHFIDAFLLYWSFMVILDFPWSFNIILLLLFFYLFLFLQFYSVLMPFCKNYMEREFC